MEVVIGRAILALACFALVFESLAVASKIGGTRSDSFTDVYGNTGTSTSHGSFRGTQLTLLSRILLAHLPVGIRTPRINPLMGVVLESNRKNGPKEGSKVSPLALCTAKSCKKQGSTATLGLLYQLASLHTGIRDLSTSNDATAAALQKGFAKQIVQHTGCLSHCSKGPNAMNRASEEVYNGVFDISSAKAALEGIGLDIPEAASKAVLLGLFGEHKLKSYKEFPKRNAGDLEEAIRLLTNALNSAGTLKVGAAALLIDLLNIRAEAYELKGDLEAAVKDMEKAAKFTKLHY